MQLNPIIEGLLNTLNKGQPYCTQGKLRYRLAGHLLCTDNDKHIYRLSITRRFLFTVKETVKDYVPVDSESVTHNMWVLLMFRSVMVHT